MPREINEDFKALEDFIKSYEIKKSLQKDEFILKLKRQHKKYFSLLIFSAELNHQKFDPIDKSIPSHDELLENFYQFLAESISEIGSALFIWIHGCYKVSQQTLRSSIENFFKAIGSVQYKEITQKKNTYEVIELAGTLNFFQAPEHAPLFGLLKTQYGELCAYAHTSTFQNMQNISALGYFPYFSKDEAQNIVNRLVSISGTYLSILSLMFPSILYEMHYKNRDVIHHSLDADINRLLSSLI